MTNSNWILLVEDNSNDVELTLAGLASLCLQTEVDVVRDGEEALDYLYCQGSFRNRAHRNPTLILLDLKMPKVDGLEVLRRIKQDAELRLIPVVMLTSSREQSDVRACFEAGVNAYVVKPVDYKNYTAAIKSIAAFWIERNEPPPGAVRVQV